MNFILTFSIDYMQLNSVLFFKQAFSYNLLNYSTVLVKKEISKNFSFSMNPVSRAWLIKTSFFVLQTSF